MNTSKTIGRFAIAQTIVALLLALTESLAGWTSGNTQVWAVITLAVLFFGITSVALALVCRTYARRQRQLVSLFLLNNVVRFLLGIIVVVVYALAVKKELLLFSVNVVVFYLVSMCFTNYVCLKNENSIKKNEDKNATPHN